MNSAPDKARFLDLLYLVGASLLLCSLCIGVFYSLTERGGFPSVYDTYLEEGDLSYAKGDLASAAEHYRLATLINREDPVPFLRLGVCLELTRQMDAAKEAFKQAVHLQLANESHFLPSHARKKKKRVKPL